MDMTETITAKSDQINAADLINPITVTIKEVRKGNPEQPVDVILVETPGRAYRPSKSMRRVMVAAWGPEASTYAGQRLTLFCNPDIMFGGTKWGGIEISHMSGLKKALTVALTATRGKKKNFTVQPLPDAAPARDWLAEADATQGDVELLRALYGAAQQAGADSQTLTAIRAKAKNDEPAS